MTIENLRNKIWTEKYRPTTLDKVIGLPTELRQTLQHLSDREAILLTSTPGVGKSCISKILEKSFKSSLVINASDERGIDVIRDRVKNFASNMSIDGGMKFIGLEEMDSLTKDAQLSLRKIIEDTPNCVWLLTANYSNKIIDALINRCLHFTLQHPNKEEIKEHLKNIISREELVMGENVIDEVIKNNYPSIRGMVKQLQKLKNLNKEINMSDVVLSGDGLQKLYDSFKERKFMQTRQLAIDSGTDYQTIIIGLHDKILFDESFLPVIKLSMIDLIADTLRHINSVPSQEIEFEALISRCFDKAQW